jgi:outer membrane protein assembly factor BamA
MRVVAVAAMLLLAVPAAGGTQEATLSPAQGNATAQAEERIAEIRVHGNHTAPTADVLAILGLTTGEPATPEALAAAEGRIRDSGRFAGVEVRRRYASIEDPTAVLIIVIVDEHAGTSADNPIPGRWRRLGLATLWMPVLRFIDGYGFTYGVRVTFDEPLGPRTRLSVPLTWGGERRAGVEVERTFTTGPLTRATGGLATFRRVNPHFDVPDSRVEARARGERRLARAVVIGGAARIARVDFAGADSQVQAAGVDIMLDTRLDPSFPRDAVHATVGWERLGFDEGAAGRLHGDIRGYLGVGGARVLALRTQFSHASDALPPFEQPLLGGGDSLRGYRTGDKAGDSLLASSVELRVPLLSPLNLARVGVKGFVDVGTVWSSASRLRDQPFDRGIGAGVYAGVAAFMLNADVAWAESGRARAHVGMGVTF